MATSPGAPGSFGETTGPAPGAPTSGMAVAALVLGIIGVVSSWCFIGLIPAILGVVFGVIGRKETTGPGAKSGRGMATAGLITGIVGLAIFVILVIVGAATDPS